MDVPLSVSFGDVRKTEEMDELIAEEVARLEKVCDHIISCRITVDRPHKHQNQGSPYRVCVDLQVPPRHEIVAKNNPNTGDMHDSLRKVMRSTFDKARRQLREVVDKKRQEVKAHPDQQAQALVERIFPDQGYGFLRTVETGREIYFHANSVLHNDFDRLEVGTGVRFAEELGEKGPQASTVEIVEKRNF